MPVTSFVLLAAVAASGSTGPTSEANRFVAEWVAAQNAGSFPRYSALYASGFTGVRRSRDKAQTFKLAAWLADRKRMFARPMTVSVSDVIAREMTGGIDLSFTQVWTSGDYRDLGKKKMTLQRTPAGLRIAREEMVTSWSLPRAIRTDDTQELSPDDYDPGDTIVSRTDPSCDDCSDDDNACNNPRGIVLTAKRRGKPVLPLPIARECHCLCPMEGDDDPRQECGCDAAAFAFERTVRLGDRTFAIVKRTARRNRTRSKIDETRVSYHLYGAVCGEIRELLLLWERDHPTDDGYSIAATGKGAPAWRAVTVTDHDGPRAEFAFPDGSCGYRAVK